MKRILFPLLFVLAFNVAHAQEMNKDVQLISVPATDALEFKTLEHDFGKIPQNKPVYYFFEIVNKSDAPLKLENVQATCGCTTPEWSREPMAPGTSNKIKVGYNAASAGPFEKFITITYNGNQTKQIKIKGTVWKAPEGSAPVNQSIQFLNQQIQ